MWEGGCDTRFFDSFGMIILLFSVVGEKSRWIFISFLEKCFVVSVDLINFADENVMKRCEM
jgi:hypothetical protein